MLHNIWVTFTGLLQARTSGGGIERRFIEKIADNATWALHSHAGNLSSVCGDDSANLYTLTAQCAAGVQPHPAPESNQSDSCQVRLLNPAIIHTHMPHVGVPLAIHLKRYMGCLFQCNQKSKRTLGWCCLYIHHIPRRFFADFAFEKYPFHRCVII